MRKKVYCVIGLILSLMLIPPMVFSAPDMVAPISFLEPEGIASLTQTEELHNEYKSHYASRVVEQIEEFSQVDWSGATRSIPLLSDPELENSRPPARQTIKSDKDRNGTEQPIVLFDKYGSSSTSRRVLESTNLQDQTHLDTNTQTTIMSTPGTDPPFESYLTPSHPQSPAMSGHWFQKKAYSVLAFQWYLPSYCIAIAVYLDIERDQDSYSRYLTVYYDGSIVYHAVIGSGGFHGYVGINYVEAGHHKVEVEINYGGWKDHQWKMTYIWPFINLYADPDYPILDFWEYFPGGHQDDVNPELEYTIRAGRSTYLDILVDNMGGTSSRTIEIYRRSSLTSGWTLDSTFTSGVAEHEYLVYKSSITDYYIKLRLVTSYSEYYGKKLTYNSPNFRAIRVEVDYMVDGGSPVMSASDMTDMLEYMKSYYILYSYGRTDYFYSSQVPVEDDLTASRFVELRSTYYSYKNSNQNDYGWLLIGTTADGGSLGWNRVDLDFWGHITYNYGMALFAEEIDDSSLPYTNLCRLVLMHEFGHYVGIIVLYWFLGWKEYYCPTSGCCMAIASGNNAVLEPWYCSYHWSLRKDRYKP